MKKSGGQILDEEDETLCDDMYAYMWLYIEVGIKKVQSNDYEGEEEDEETDPR